VIDRILIQTYTICLCGVFGIVFTAQVLGFLSAYTPTLAITSTLIIAVLAGWVYQRYTLVLPKHADETTHWQISMFAVLVIFFLVVFGIRLFTFPYSSVGEFFNTDVLGYHLPKAIELVRTGSIWDLSILYGDYPNGTESLVSFTLLLSGQITSISLTHLLTVILFVLTNTLLIRRYTPFSGVLSFAIAIGILFIPMVYSLVMLVGKNDLLLSTMVLGGILHAPVQPKRTAMSWHILGLAYCTLIAVSTKASGVIVLGGVWLWMLWLWFSAYRKQQARAFLAPFVFVISVLLMLPSTFWLVRNIIMMRRIVSPEVSSFSVTSLFANWNNPLVYNSGSESLTLFLAVAITIGVLLLLLWRKHLTTSIVLLVGVMWVGFITSPLSAFHTPQSSVLHIEWRYALHLWIYLIVLGLVSASELIEIAYRWVIERRALAWAGIITVVGMTGLAIITFGTDTLFQQYERRLYSYQGSPRQTSQVYEYVQENIINATIWYEGAEHLWLYGQNFSNRPIEGRKYPLGMPEITPYPVPDYAVIYNQIGLANEQRWLGTTYNWEVVWQDEFYTVYKRIQ
jgi:hypothetical protein